MDKNIKFALIGCGRISPNHLDAIKNAPHASLAAVCDLDEEKAKAAACAGGITAWYTDMEDMLKCEDIDACCILTPSGLHAAHALTAAKYKKHLLVEKPLDISLENIDRLIAGCKEHGVKLGCVFQRRFFSAARETKKAVENGYLGKITMAEASLKYYRDQEYYDSDSWRGTYALDGGGALMNQGIHGIDLIQWIMGGITSVYANTDTKVWNIEAEDTAVLSVRFKNGALGVIQGATTVYPGLDTVCCVHGSEGSISFGNDGFYYWKLKDESIKMPDVNGSLGGLNCAYSSNNYGHIQHVEDMALAIIEDRDPLITGEEARKSVEIILVAYRSSKEKKEIIL